MIGGETTRQSQRSANTGCGQVLQVVSQSDEEEIGAVVDYRSVHCKYLFSFDRPSFLLFADLTALKL